MTINRKTRQWSDLNLLFSAHPSTADVTKKIDDEAIKASLKNLISTKNYERPFHPEIGCQIYSLLFEPFSPVTVQVMKRTIADTVEKFEPRVSLLDIAIQDRPDNNDLTVTITFKTINTEQPVTLTTTISRAR